jgi:hypothetical protein
MMDVFVANSCWRYRLFPGTFIGVVGVFSDASTEVVGCGLGFFV